MSDAMSDERLAHLRAANKPVGDHLSSLTADEVAELIAEVDALRGISDHAFRVSQYGVQLMNERDQARAELARLAADEHSRFSRDFENEEEQRDVGPFFEPGHVYLSENRAFRFTCERVLDGVALGVEERLDGRPQFGSNRVWRGVMAEGCWNDVTNNEEGGDRA